MTLAELVTALERRAQEAEAEGATAPVANVYRRVLADLAPLAGNGRTEMPTTEDDRLLTAADVAGRLGCSVKLVYRSAGRWPFTRRVGSRTLRFSAAGMERWLERRR